MKNEIKTRLSVIDTEIKYEYDYEETTYGADTIVSYGKDNAAPLLFKNCYRNSATLKSIIDGTVNYVLGDDIKVNAGLFIDKVNRNGMTMRQFIANISLSYLMYGGFAVQVIYNRLGTVVELFPLDFSKCRTNESGTKIFYSKKNWTKWGSKSEKYDRFDPKNIDINKLTQIYYYKGDFTTNVYPLPPYYAALKDILTEIECANYSLNSVSNGFTAKYILNMPDVGNMNDAMKEDIEKSIKAKFCGSDSNSNFMIYYGDGNDNKMEVSKIEGDDGPERYIAIKDNARQNIFISLRCTPLLFGLVSASNGFSTQEYSDSYKLYQKTVISPIQDIIKEAVSRMTMTENAIEIAPFIINFEN